MTRFRLLPLLLFVSFLSFGQSNFQSGYVITNSHDTLKGYIDYKEWSINPSSIAFRSTPGEGTQTFTIGDCRAFSINSRESYQRFAVDMSMSEVDVARLSIGMNLAKIRDTVFLRGLQAGTNVTLFSYKDPLKTRFYVLEKGGAEPYELIRQLYYRQREAQNTVMTNNEYIRQLLILLRKFNKATKSNERKLSGLQYYQNDLLKIVSIINDQDFAKSKVSPVRLFAGAGIHLSRAGYSGADDLANSDARSRTYLGPSISAGIDLLKNPSIGKFLLRTELTFLMSENEVSTTTKSESSARLSHSFKQMSLILTPQLIYNIYNTDAMKFFAGAGVGMNFSKYSDNITKRYNSRFDEEKIYEDDVHLKKFNFSLQGKLGVVLKKRFEFSAGYVVPSAISDYNSFSVHIQRTTFGVYYLFGK